jgi:hypothetical protein
VNTVANMTIEKLSKVANTHVPCHFKAKWLLWWNSTMIVRIGNKFSSIVPLKEKVLEFWLHKAFFWAQVNLSPPLD